MNIYKLKFSDKDFAIATLIDKGVYIESEEQLVYGQGIQAVVEIGLIVSEQGTYDEDGNEITAPIYAEGYHYDIMCEQEIDFANAIEPNNPKHTFAGYMPIVEIDPNVIDNFIDDMI